MDNPQEPQNERLARLEEKGDHMEARMNKGDEKFALITARITELEKQVTYLKGGLAVIAILYPIILRFLGGA